MEFLSHDISKMCETLKIVRDHYLFLKTKEVSKQLIERFSSLEKYKKFVPLCESIKNIQTFNRFVNFHISYANTIYIVSIDEDKTRYSTSVEREDGNLKDLEDSEDEDARELMYDFADVISKNFFLLYHIADFLKQDSNTKLSLPQIEDD